MALLQILDMSGGLIPAVLILLLISFSSIAIYRLYFHPIAHVPGPFLARLTSLWLFRHSYLGDEASALQRLHHKYGPVMRIAPNEVDIADGAALQSIYVSNGGFLKAPYYRNFDIDGHATVFSAVDPSHRQPRAKAVLGLFSTGNIRAGSDKIEPCVDSYIDRLRKDSRSGKPVDVLNASRSLALDVVSSYLFHRSYNGMMESKLSAGQFVDTFVAVGRFFYLPNWIFLLLETLEATMNPDKAHVEKSMATVDDFVAALVDEANPGDDTYQGRLKNAGFSDHENKAQCKDLMFAGTDSTGMNLATIVWNLAKRPDLYTKLQAAVNVTPEGTDPQTNPYIRGVVNEGLRLAMANPTRFPRFVPPSGYTTPTEKPVHLPSSTIVGCTPYILYLNGATYDAPQVFDPDRWSAPTTEMSRDHIPFGLGPRQCIARNLATAELFIAVDKLARSGVLTDAKAVGHEIRIKEWFNSKVIGEKIELAWL